MPTFGSTEDRDATRSAELVLRDGRDLREDLEDLLEHVGDTAPMQGGDRVRLTEPQVPQRGGLGLLAGVVDLVGHEEHRLVRLAEQAHHVLVGRRRPDGGVDDEEHDVGEVDRDLGLSGHRRVDALRVGLPPAGVDEGEAAVEVVALVRDAVASDPGRVLDDGLATAEDAVDERRLAHVRATDDGDDRQCREVADALLALLGDLEHVEVVLVELVVGETGAQGGGTLLGEILVDVGEALGEVVVDDRLVVVLVALVGHGVSSEVWCARGAGAIAPPRAVRPGSRRSRHRRSARSRAPSNPPWSRPRRRS